MKKMIGFVGALVVAGWAVNPVWAPLEKMTGPLLKERTYALEGQNPGSGTKYSGTVAIQKTGDTYRLTWSIGGNQSQVGVGILERNVLSVGYFDSSGKDAGVVSYRLMNDGSLEGKWAPLGAKGFGLEFLR